MIKRNKTFLWNERSWYQMTCWQMTYHRALFAYGYPDLFQSINHTGVFLLQYLHQSLLLQTAILWMNVMMTKLTATVEQVMTSSWQVQKPSSFHCNTIFIQFNPQLQCFLCLLPSMLNYDTCMSFLLGKNVTVSYPHFNAWRRLGLSTYYRTYSWSNIYFLQRFINYI